MTARGRAGFLEGIEDGWLNGWAYDPAVDVPARIAVSIAGSPAVEIVADRYRADVQHAGFGDGICGFRIACLFAAPIACRWADSGIDLPGSPWRPDPRRALDGSAGALRGRLDPPVRGARALTGAMVDLSDPRRRLTAGLRLDGETVSTGRACRYSDSARRWGADGFHAFRLDWPGDRTPARAVEVGEADGGRILFRPARRRRRDAGFS